MKRRSIAHTCSAYIIPKYILLVRGKKVKGIYIIFHKKTAPGIPGTMLKEPYSGGQEGGDLGVESAEFLLGAGAGHLLREPEIQAEHTHQIFAVDMPTIVAYGNIKRLFHGQMDKGLHLSERIHGNMKLTHKDPSHTVQTEKYHV